MQVQMRDLTEEVLEIRVWVHSHELSTDVPQIARTSAIRLTRCFDSEHIDADKITLSVDTPYMVEICWH